MYSGSYEKGCCLSKVGLLSVCIFEGSIQPYESYEST
jgi:hypothetical protein